MGYPDLLVLRHGQTEWNRQGRLQGELDSPLTETGLAQARCQRDILQGLSLTGWQWFSSPQGRAVQTAKIAMGTGLADIRQDARLAEITMGQWTGRLRSEVAQEVPHLFEGQSLLWYDHAPEGEGLDKLAGRASDFLDHVTGPSIVVTHGITSRVLRCLAMGLPVSEFASVGGGQGVVYHVSEGTCRLLKTGEGGTEID